MEKKRGKDSWKIKRLKKVRKAGVFVFTDLHPNFFSGYGPVWPGFRNGKSKFPPFLLILFSDN